MWFGTWDGINRYDGHNFVSYKSYPGDMSKLKNDRIDEIEEDGTAYLWLRDYDNQVYRFDKRTEQFLPLSDVITEAHKQKLLFRRIISNEKGTVWLQTQDQGIFYIPNTGLPSNKYLRFEKGLQKPYQLPSNQINFFYQDMLHNVWIGTPKGLTHLVKDKLGGYVVSNNLSEKDKLNFTSVTEDQQNIYFCNAEGYLLMYNKSSKISILKKLLVNGLNNLYASKKRSIIYCSTAEGKILSINPTDLSITNTSFIASEPIYSIYEDQTGCLWVEPELHGIFRFDPVSGLSKKFIQQNDASYGNGNEHSRVFEDNKGVVWVTLKGGGFGYYNALANTFDYFYDGPDPNTRKFSNMINFLYYDKSGILWLSTDMHGLEKIIFQGNYFDQQLLVTNSIVRSDNEIRGIYTDRKNRLWIGTKSDRLYVTKNGQNVPVHFINEPKEGFGSIYSMLQDHNGTIWLGTKLNGLFKAEPIDSTELSYKISHYKADERDATSISGNDIYSLAEDKNGNIWVGTFDKGLNQVVTVNQHTTFINTKNSYRLYPKNAFQKVRHIASDKNGNLWIGTTSGLLIMQPANGDPANNKFISYGKIPGDKESLGNNNIQFILRDSHNNMWLSTAGGGLCQAFGEDPYKKLTFKNYTIADGLPNDYLLSCLEDNRGNLWLATQKGISRFNIASKRFRNYDSDDGLLKTEFSEASCTKLADGTFVFGTIKGYLVFNPEKVTDPKTDTRIVLTNLQVNNQDRFSGDKDSILKSNINYTDGIKLNYNQNNISIDYMLLDYRSVNKQDYVYRLTGLDTVWHNNQSQRRATYTNLEPGHYTFEVKSLNGELYANQPSRSLAITILPPPWRTWWAYLLYLVLGIIILEVARRNALAILRLRQRIAVEQKLAELKLNFFTSVSHELRTPLTLILNPIQEIAKIENLSDQVKSHVDIVRKNAERMVRFVNQLLDLRKVQSGKSVLKLSKVEIVSFINNISTYFADVALEKHINLTVSPNVNELYVFIDAEKIDIVIYNLLANAFKFSPTGRNIRVAINQSLEKKSATIEISDEGNGVPEKTLKDIFELYFEGDHPTGKNMKGSGIGLALSKELVELHHGKIWANNNQQHGLTVTVELLLGKQHFSKDEAQLVDLPETIEKAQNQTEQYLKTVESDIADLPFADLPLVLLVEDNVDLQIFLKNQLALFYRVETAADGEEGLQKALQIMPELILSDVMMPKMDGIEMLDMLKNNPATSHIPVVLLSARSSVENQIEGLKYGADLYMTKPFHNDLLLASIANLIHKRKKLFESLVDNKAHAIDINPSAIIIITSKDESFLKKVIEIVENGMTDPDFNIELVAETMNMGRSAFYKKFKSLTDQAPVELVRDMRLKRAKQYMDSGETNISTISFNVGFNNSRYFSTCFKEKFKLTPTEYIRTNIKKVG